MEVGDAEHASRGELIRRYQTHLTSPAAVVDGGRREEREEELTGGVDCWSEVCRMAVRQPLLDVTDEVGLTDPGGGEEEVQEEGSDLLQGDDVGAEGGEKGEEMRPALSAVLGPFRVQVVEDVVGHAGQAMRRGPIRPSRLGEGFPML